MTTSSADFDKDIQESLLGNTRSSDIRAILLCEASFMVDAQFSVNLNHRAGETHSLHRQSERSCLYHRHFPDVSPDFQRPNKKHFVRNTNIVPYEPLTWWPLDSSSKPKDRTTVLVGWNPASINVSIDDLQIPNKVSFGVQGVIWDTYRMPMSPLLSSELPRPQTRLPR